MSDHSDAKKKTIRVERRHCTHAVSQHRLNDMVDSAEILITSLQHIDIGASKQLQLDLLLAQPLSARQSTQQVAPSNALAHPLLAEPRLHHIENS